MTLKRCTNCGLTSNFPGVSFDAKGVCSYCQALQAEDEPSESDSRYKQTLKNLAVANRTSSDYDVVVAYSGGKDSTYTLQFLTEEVGLKCLAITIDNGFLSEQALQNCSVVSESLGTDFMMFKPNFQFMKNMYKASITGDSPFIPSAKKRSSEICGSCINLINSYMIKMAIKFNVSLIAGGYIGGQVPKNAVLLDINLALRDKHRSLELDKYKQLFGAENLHYFQNDKAQDNDKNILIINPMLELRSSERTIKDKIKQLGWRESENTGSHSSNCTLNDVGIAVHIRKYGFHPYELEVTEQVRQGILSREEAIFKLENYIPLIELKDQLIRLDLNESSIGS